MNIKSISLLLLILAAAVAAFLIFQNQRTSEPGKEPVSSEKRDHQEFIFLLQYIGRDYQFAVEGGAVVNEFEYREMIAFCQRSIELYLALQQHLDQNLTLFQLQQLRQMVYEKVERQLIGDLTKTIIRDFAKEFNIKTAPAKAPEIERGRGLYKAGGCGVCHGAGGAGDGRAAGWLDPGPGSFREPAKMKEATPYEFYNVIRFGVAGTAMPSYEEAFSPQEVWDIAFYLMTLREGFDPRWSGGKPAITLEDLATRPDADLLNEIMDRRKSGELTEETAEAAISTALDFLRNHPETVK